MERADLPEPTRSPAYTSIVYYITWDRGTTVKIGTTTNPKSRFAAYGTRGSLDLLAAHPGGYPEERAQHRRFRHLRISGERELFHQGIDLVEHIAKVRATWPNWKQVVNEVAWNAGARHGKSIFSEI